MVTGAARGPGEAIARAFLWQGAAVGRLGAPAETGSAAVVLAGDMSNYVTGTLLKVSGGRFR